MAHGKVLGHDRVDAMREQCVRIIIVQVMRVVDQPAAVEIDLLVTTGNAQLQVAGDLGFEERADAVGARIVEDILIVISIDERALESNRDRRAGREAASRARTIDRWACRSPTDASALSQK